MIVTIVGTGLIGGSMALRLRAEGFATEIRGVDASESHAQKALERGLVDRIGTLETELPGADLVIVAVPISAALQLLPTLMELNREAVVMDVGSTKASICALANSLPGRERFVATHPMWGTEHSGPEAATTAAFEGRVAVICDREASSKAALALVQKLYGILGMQISYMMPAPHDMHVAYVSHISHITSFALANTVLEKEVEEDAIFSLASAGFESTVRLAKSNAQMWQPILLENRTPVLEVLDEHLRQLQGFRQAIADENGEALTALIQSANRIKKILP